MPRINDELEKSAEQKVNVRLELRRRIEDFCRVPSVMARKHASLALARNLLIRIEPDGQLRPSSQIKAIYKSAFKDFSRIFVFLEQTL